jgi:hypothetical protein
MMSSNSAAASNVLEGPYVTSSAALGLNLYHVTKSPHSWSSNIPDPGHSPEDIHLSFWSFFSNKELVMAYFLSDPVAQFYITFSKYIKKELL